MKSLVALLFIIFFSIQTSLGQTDLSWKAHLTQAEELFESSRYLEAAEHYHTAWKKKPQKIDFLYKAAEAYYIVKDYRNAAESYKLVNDKSSSKYPLVGLKYGRCLKQLGEYENASSQLLQFKNSYKGQEKKIIEDIVLQEIKGCELGLHLSNSEASEVFIEHLDQNINTPEIEFAPFGIDRNTLYYSSTLGVRAQLYKSSKEDGKWQKPQKLKGFPRIDNDHYCNGALSPSGDWFYFTICKSQENWGGLTTKCELYVTKQVRDRWTKPERLRDYVNIEGSTSTHPSVVHVDGLEYLFFASNREGSLGGMDIWYMTRSLKSNDIDFTFPVNCGPTINTVGDEITPFYDVNENSLYFSSNGHVSIGGFDLYYAKGIKSEYSKATNLGLPYNSSADDFYYSKTAQSGAGYFVSNRTFGAEKISTTDEDIFSFINEAETNTVRVDGKILDKKTNEGISHTYVVLYQYQDNGQKAAITSQKFSNNQYELMVPYGAEYELEVQKEGYLPKSYVFSVRKNTTVKKSKDLYLERMRIKPESTSVISTNTVPVEIHTNQNVNKIVEGKKAPVETKNNEVLANSHIQKPPTTFNSPPPNQQSSASVDIKTIPKRSNTIEKHILNNATNYKIQIIAVNSFDISHYRYRHVKNLGRIETEYIPNKDLYRVLVTDYPSIESAKNALPFIRESGFSSAYIVEYQGATRVGRIRN